MKVKKIKKRILDWDYGLNDMKETARAGEQVRVKERERARER